MAGFGANGYQRDRDGVTKSTFCTKDALHIACAIEAAADYFITTDALIIKKLHGFSEIQVVNPLDFIDCLEEMP